MDSLRLAAWFRRHRAKIGLIAFAVGTTCMLAGPNATGSSVSAQHIQTIGRPGELVEFNTDACGDLASIKGRKANLIKSGGVIDPGGDDADDSRSAWGMSQDDLAISKQWMMQHPDMAVETDAVQRSCANDPLADVEVDDDDGPIDIA